MLDSRNRRIEIMLNPAGRPADEGFERAFPRIHRRALGIAVGVTTGSALFLVTALHIIAGPRDNPLGLLSQYFWLYDVTWFGALAGLVWGFAVGFVSGWILAFVRNFTIGLWLLVVRAKSELSQRRNILDHIR